MVLRERILDAIALVQFNDAFIVIVKIDRIVSRNIIIQRKDQIIFHIHLRRVGVHPEHIRHLSAGSACFEQCPVVVPVDYIDGDIHAGFLRPGISDLLQPCQLVVIPDVYLDFPCRKSCPGHSHYKTAGKHTQ